MQCKHRHSYKCTCTYMYIQMYMYVYVRTSYIHVGMGITCTNCVCVCTCTYMYMHIHVHVFLWWLNVETYMHTVGKTIHTHVFADPTTAASRVDWTCASTRGTWCTTTQCCTSARSAWRRLGSPLPTQTPSSPGLPVTSVERLVSVYMYVHMYAFDNSLSSDKLIQSNTL